MGIPYQIVDFVASARYACMQVGKQLSAKDKRSHNCHLEWLFF